MKALWRIIATFFGLGFCPVAPGTVASLAILFLYKFVLFRLAWPWLAAVLLALAAAGVYASSAYAAELGQEDPRRVVVDEAAGQLLAYVLVQPSWLNLGLGFALFRFFDIVKPFPISRAEKLPRGWGIMADDIVAGLASAIILHFYLFLK